MTFTRYAPCPVCGGCAIEEVDCDLGGKVVGRACMDDERHEAVINRRPLTAEEAARLGVEGLPDICLCDTPETCPRCQAERMDEQLREVAKAVYTHEWYAERSRNVGTPEGEEHHHQQAVAVLRKLIEESRTEDAGN